MSSDRRAQFSGDLTRGQTRSGAAGRPHLSVGNCNCVHPQEYERRPEAFAALGTHSVPAHLANNPDGPQLTRQIEQAGYLDALIQTGILGRGTFIPAREPIRLDYIWLRSDWECHVTHAGIVEEPAGQEASDHRPVVAELEFLESSANRTRQRS